MSADARVRVWQAVQDMDDALSREGIPDDAHPHLVRKASIGAPHLCNWIPKVVLRVRVSVNAIVVDATVRRPIAGKTAEVGVYARLQPFCKVECRRHDHGAARLGHAITCSNQFL